MSLGRVLVVDDDKNICELLRLYLEKEGYGVILAHDGEEAVVKFNALKPDIILLDIMLPGIDGWQVCREIRKTNNIPIIMLSAKGETFDKVLGLELGADDYMIKPFETKELVARVKAVLRRYQQPAATSVPEKPSQVVEYPDLTINLGNYSVLYYGKNVEMPPKELELLYFLASSPNQVFTRELWESATECPVVFPDGVGVVGWMVPGGRAIAEKTAELMEKYDVAIWAHHGMFCSGEDFDLTFGLMHTVEKSAEILVKILSMTPRKIQTITPENFRELAHDFNVTLPEEFLYEKKK